MATFEELTNLSTSEEPARPLVQVQQSGADQRRAQGDAEAQRAEETTIGETFGAAFERNIGTMLYDEVQRKWSHQPDENFDADQWVTENRETLPGVNLEDFRSVRSVGEAEELRDDMLRAQNNDLTIASKGYTGVAASLLTGLVDPAEIAIAVGTGGFGKGASVTQRLLSSTAAGVRGGAAAGAVANEVDPVTDSTQLVFGALSGAVLSSGMSLAASGFNASAQAARRNYGAEVMDLPPTDRDYSEASVFPFQEYEFRESAQDLGASRTFGPDFDYDSLSPRARSVYDSAMETIRGNHLGTRNVDSDFSSNRPEARAYQRMVDAVNNSSYDVLKTDFDRLSNSGSRVELAMAYNLFESPDGRLRNNRSGAMLKETYEQRLSSQSLPKLDESFQAWAGKRNMGLLDRNRPGSREAFDREVFAELEARYHEGKSVTSDPTVKQAADAIDNNMADALRVAKGREGETGMDGFENIEQRSGYVPHKWSGAAMRRAMARTGATQEDIVKLLETAYARSNPDLDIEYRQMLAKATVRRAIAKEDGIDTNMLNTLDSDSQEFLREMLKDSGYDDKVIDRLIESIRGKKEEQGVVSNAKSRISVDMRTEVNGISLLDLADTNMTRLVSQYNRTISGNAALARKGITNRAHRKDMIDAALAERRARGLPADAAQREYLEDMFTYFDSGPIAGGINANVSRAKRMTNLALLNQMGLTQLGETGAQLAAVGLDTWRKHARVVFKQITQQGPEGPIISELRPIMGEVGKEHLLFRDDLMLDELSTARDLNTFLGKLDYGLGKGQRLQGYASGFYKVREFQQRVAVASMADKMMRRVRDGEDLDLIEGLGLNPDTLKKYLDIVEFNEDGSLNKLNLDQWDPVDAEDLALGLNRHTHQVVQKALAGEESVWMHKTVGSLYMHLKSFPMLAMRKQAGRLSGLQRPEMVASLMWGLAIAGTVQQARQVINGRPENVGIEEFAKGAFAMSNLTGWVPMLADPAAAMLGMDDLRFNRYGLQDINTGVLSTPPILPTLNRMARAPGALNPWADLSNSERIRIMQTTPIIGNLYGFSALFNSMK